MVRDGEIPRAVLSEMFHCIVIGVRAHADTVGVRLPNVSRMVVREINGVTAAEGTRLD